MKAFHGAGLVAARRRNFAAALFYKSKIEAPDSENAENTENMTETARIVNTAALEEPETANEAVTETITKKAAETPRDRSIKVGRYAGLLVMGAAVCVFLAQYGIGIPCMFHLVTGFYCPGCGVSRMGIALLHGDIRAAWHYNPVILSMLPLLFVLGCRFLTRYIKTGSMQAKKGENAIIYAMIAVLLVFGVLRNLPPFYVAL